jgi:(1->4)-alpha-D-glucan 1-alpha-D-glucosylmutase
VLADQDFVADLENFLAEHRLVELGQGTSLAQLTLLLTCPGVPDIYQGTELWDLSLVDPDNRRPVDYAARRALLADLAQAGPDEAMTRAEVGGPKLWLIGRVLGYRRRSPAVFGPGSDYHPVPAEGAKAGHIVAFLRDLPGEAGGLVVVVPRLVARLGGGWADTAVDLPPGRWASVLGDTQLGGARRHADEFEGGPIGVADLLGRFPVAVLARVG